eukprot:7436190-Pyramimonas_sp.AAC.1
MQNKRAREQICSKQGSGGLRRGALLHMHNSEYSPAVHTPAHRKLEDFKVAPAPGRWVGLANWRADREAKRALDLHPGPPQAEEGDLKRSIRGLEMVARLAAAVLPISPR